MDVMEEVVVVKVGEFTKPDDDAETWNVRALADWINLTFPLGVSEKELLEVASKGEQAPLPGSLFDGLSASQFAVCLRITEAVRKSYELKVSFEQAEQLRTVERFTILSAIDRLWQEHLYGMDSLRNSIGLRAYGQRDPLIEYKAEAFKIFEDLMVNIKSEICHNIFRSASSLMAFEQFLQNLPQRTVHASASAFGSNSTSSSETAPPPKRSRPSDIVSEAADAVEKAKPVRTGPKVGRNDPCPCGSGKKYKQCCGK
jgi:preprotein translocase subunit SecA